MCHVVAFFRHMPSRRTHEVLGRIQFVLPKICCAPMVEVLGRSGDASSPSPRYLHRCSPTSCPLAPSRTELCPGDAPKTICSGTYVITQADVDSGKRNNKATVTCKSPDGQDIENSQHNTVTVLGTSEVSIGEACAD